MAIVVHTPRFGGAEFYVEQLCAALPKRWSPVLLAVEPLPSQLRDAAEQLGVETIEIPALRGKLDLAGWRRLWRTLRAVDVDLFHFNLVEPTNNRHPMALCVLQRRPFVLTLHAVFAITPAAYRRALGVSFGRARTAIAVSSEIAAALDGDYGVRSHKVRIIRNGVPRQEPVAASRSDVVRIGAAGRLSNQKGFDVLIEAFASLVEEGLPVELLVWGEGGRRDELERAAAGLPVRFVGTPGDVPEFVSSVDVFCLPSRWEGLPFSLLEAMMAGLPCVATDVGDVAEALDGAGIVVPPLDVGALAAALRGLVGDPDRRATLGRAAHDRAVAAYTSEAMVDATAAAYDDAVS